MRKLTLGEMRRGMICQNGSIERETKPSLEVDGNVFSEFYFLECRASRDSKGEFAILGFLFTQWRQLTHDARILLIFVVNDRDVIQTRAGAIGHSIYSELDHRDFVSGLGLKAIETSADHFHGNTFRQMDAATLGRLPFFDSRN